MPLYLYKCPYCGNERYVRHDINYVGMVQCEVCEWYMHKAPQLIAVNWNGMKPSAGGVSDYVQGLIADAPRTRDEVEQHKEMKS